MKTILLLLLSFSIYSQSYKVDLVGNYAIASKGKGSVEVTDKTFTASFADRKVTFDIVSKRSEVIYITDGYMVDWVQIIESKGKKKGIEYTKMLILNFDARRKINDVVIYYCN